MSESCLVLSPPPRKAMPRDSEMGINSRGSVNDVETFLEPERSRRRNKSAISNSARSEAVKQSQSQTPLAVTESDASDTEMKGAQKSTLAGGGSRAGENRLQKRKIETIEGSEKAEEEGKDGSSGRSSEGTPSLPQHEQIEQIRPVEPMDISYSATPASLRLKGSLLSRLDAAIHTGRIQVVRTIGACGYC
jgi:hypothetical protein